MTEGSAEPLLRRSVARSRRRLVLTLRRAGKPSRGGLVLRALPLVLLASACSIGSEELSVTPVTVHASARQSSAGELTAQARRALTDAIVATGADYRFETTVTVGDHVTAHVTGTVSGNAARMRAAPEDAFTDYVRTRNGAWVVASSAGRAMGESAGEVAPLEVLLAPEAVDVHRADGARDVVLRAVYPGSAVGAPAEERVEVDVTIRSGIVHRVAYEVPAGGETAQVVTVIEAQRREQIPVGG